MNQPLAFGLLLAGGIALEAGLTGKGLASVLQGTAGPIPATGSSLTANAATNGVGGVGQAIANTAQTFSGLTTTPGSSLAQSGMQLISQISAKMGWGAAGATAWEGVEADEDSSYSLTAQNPTSDAYGEAQFIQGPSEYAQYGGNPDTQAGELTAMANYIRQRYGTPEAALQHENEYHWY